MSLRDYVRIFKRHKFWILAWFLLITTGYMFYENMLKPKKYNSHAIFSVDERDKKDGSKRKDKEERSEILIFGESPSMNARKSIIEGSVVMIDAFNRYIAIRKDNPDKSQPGDSAINQSPYPVFVKDSPTDDNNLAKLQACVRIITDANNKTFTIRADSTNPHKAKWIVDSIVAAYTAYEIKRSQKVVLNVIEKNTDVLKKRRENIQDIQTQKKIILDKLSKRYGPHMVWEEGPDRKLGERDEIRLKISEVEKVINNLKSEIKEFEAYAPDRWLIEDGEGNKIVELQNTLFTQRETLQQELANLRIDFTDKHPKVIKKLAELNTLNAAFPKLAQEIIDRKVGELKRGLNNAEANYQTLETGLLRVSKELSIISENQQTFKDFEEKLKKHRDAVGDIEKHIEKLQEELERTKDPIEVTTPAVEGIKEDSAPNTIYYIMVFGVIIGLGFAYVLEYLDDTIRTPHDVEKFVGLRVIGTVPLLSKNEEKLLHRIALKSPISEMMNTLSMIIQSWMLKMKGQVMLIVSSKPGEGKSTFITNLAVALCRGGEKVVLIDSDLRKPSLHRFFGVDNSVGLSNYLEDAFGNDVEDTDEAKIAKIVHHTEVEGLFIIPSGPIPSNPVGLLKGENVERLLNHLKTYIGVILIDTPPLAMIDAGVLATKVNAVVTVMDAGKVTKKEALAGKHLIENVGGNSIGVILNKVTLEGEEYYYYFEGYSYYYGSNRNRKKKPV